MKGLVCDFCSTPVTADDAWTCAARDFDTGLPAGTLVDGTPVNQHSAGAWCACRRCVSLIRAGRREALARRAVDSLLRRNPELRGQRQVMLRGMRELQDDFWSHREGEPRRTTAEEYAAAEAGPKEVLGFTYDPLRTAQWLKEMGWRQR